MLREHAPDHVLIDVQSKRFVDLLRDSWAPKSSITLFQFNDDLYAAFNILTGRIMGKVAARARSKEFLAFLRQIDRCHPKGKDLHIILDNHSAHKTQEIRDWLAARPYIHFHFTPTSASWLNAVEGWFAQLERRALYGGIFTRVPELKTELMNFIEVHNRVLAKPFTWTKDAKTILAAVDRAKNALPN